MRNVMVSIVYCHSVCVCVPPLRRQKNGEI